jgi:hypothetical protein
LPGASRSRANAFGFADGGLRGGAALLGPRPRYDVLSVVRSAESLALRRRAARVVLVYETMDDERSRGKQIATLIGESLREVAILVLVFAPLDVVTQGIALTLRWWLAMIVTALIGFSIGVYLETR